MKESKKIFAGKMRNISIQDSKDSSRSKRISNRRMSARQGILDQTASPSMVKAQKVKLPADFEELAQISVFSLRQNLENLIADPSQLNLDKVSLQVDKNGNEQKPDQVALLEAYKRMWKSDLYQSSEHYQETDSKRNQPFKKNMLQRIQMKHLLDHTKDKLNQPGKATNLKRLFQKKYNDQSTETFTNQVTTSTLNNSFKVSKSSMENINKRTNTLDEAKQMNENTKLLNQTERKMKIAKFTLSQMLSGGGVKYESLTRDQDQKLDIIQGTFLIYKALIKDVQPPVKIQLNALQGDIIAYVSRNHRQPSSKHYDKVYKNPQTIMVDDTTKFTQEFLYITFETENGCTADIKMTLPEEDKRAELKAMKQIRQKGKAKGDDSSTEEEEGNQVSMNGFAGEKRIEHEINKKIQKLGSNFDRYKRFIANIDSIKANQEHKRKRSNISNNDIIRVINAGESALDAKNIDLSKEQLDALWVNFKKKNKNNVRATTVEAQFYEKLQREEDTQIKRENTKIQADALLENSIKMNYFKNNKWMLIKWKRQQMQAVLDQLKACSQRSKEMIGLVTANQMFRKAWFNFAEKKVKRMVQQRAFMVAFMLQFKLKIRIKRTGKTYDERLRKIIRKELVFDAFNMIDIQEHRAVRGVYTFIKDVIKMNTLRGVVSHWFEEVVKLQKAIKHSKMKRAAKKFFLKWHWTQLLQKLELEQWQTKPKKKSGKQAPPPKKKNYEAITQEVTDDVLNKYQAIKDMNFNFLEQQRRLIADTKDGLSADEIYKRTTEVEDLQSRIKDLEQNF